MEQTEKIVALLVEDTEIPDMKFFDLPDEVRPNDLVLGVLDDDLVKLTTVAKRFAIASNMKAYLVAQDLAMNGKSMQDIKEVEFRENKELCDLFQKLFWFEVNRRFKSWNIDTLSMRQRDGKIVIAASRDNDNEPMAINLNDVLKKLFGGQ